MNPIKHTSRHILIRLLNVKDKEKIVNEFREKQLTTYKRSQRTLSPDFFSDMMEVRRQWHAIHKIMKESTHQPRFLYPAKVFFKNEGEI